MIRTWISLWQGRPCSSPVRPNVSVAPSRLTLAESGANVAITYLSSQPEAEATVRALADWDVDALAVRCDLRDPESIEQTVAAVVEEFGRIDVLVNNAGRFESEALEEISVEQWDAMFATNTRAPFLMARAAHPHLRAAKGRIINIGSLGGLHPWATHGHYCTSKAALHMLSKTMAKAWAPEISVNCVAPGMIVQGEVERGLRALRPQDPDAAQRNRRRCGCRSQVLRHRSPLHYRPTAGRRWRTWTLGSVQLPSDTVWPLRSREQQATMQYRGLSTAQRTMKLCAASVVMT